MLHLPNLKHILSNVGNVGDLHTDITGEGPRALVTPVKLLEGGEWFYKTMYVKYYLLRDSSKMESQGRESRASGRTHCRKANCYR